MTALGAAAIASCLTAGAAQAQVRAVVNPPVLQPRTTEAPSTNLMAERVAPAGTGEKVLDLNIVYTDGEIYNPSSGQYDKVRLRSYKGTGINPDAPFVSPTIETVPGETVRISLNNKLPVGDQSCTSDPLRMNSPHCFNSTNLHSHGLWVNPSGNGDNVLLSINPGVSFQYEYNIPADHPAGTFWYHNHRHGSTALQVSSGMAGALIIRGDRLPTPTENGDLDVLLKDMTDRVIVFQQIQYGCLDSNGNIKTLKNNAGKITAWVCDPGDTGVIESYSDGNGVGFGPGSWDQSGRFTSINGEILPTFEATQGRYERWRMIHGGVRDTIDLQFFKMKQNARVRPDAQFKSTAMDNVISRSCSSEPVPYYLAAADGLSLAAVQATKGATLQPGYRFDALVAFPEAGDYCVVDSASKAAASVGGSPVSPRLLGMVRVGAGTSMPSGVGRLTETLVAAADRTMPADVKAAVVADLQNNLQLTRFVPHRTIEKTELTGRQVVTFLVDITDQSDVTFNIGGADYAPRPYDPGRIDRQLTLGDVEEWVLTSNLAGHPFHIHVNPFQVDEILDPQGRDVSGLGASDGGDSQYPGLKGVWKDTLFVKEGYTLKVRTRYQRYVGQYVLHCHILDHEDQGMMQNVAIGLPGGTVLNDSLQKHSH